MSSLTIFEFGNNGIRTQLDAAGDIWFCAVDLCNSLGFVNSRQALATHVEHGGCIRMDTLTTGGKQSMNYVNETGAYELALGSTKQEGKRFREWVVKEVIPSVRKTGGYSIGSASLGQSQEETIRSLTFIHKELADWLGIPAGIAVCSLLDDIEANTGLSMIGARRAVPALPSAEEVATLNVTAVGKLIGLTPQQTNLLLRDAGFQCLDSNNKWMLLPAGRPFAGAFPFTHKGHSGFSIRWKPEVANVIKHK